MVTFYKFCFVKCCAVIFVGKLFPVFVVKYSLVGCFKVVLV